MKLEMLDECREEPTELSCCLTELRFEMLELELIPAELSCTPEFW